MILTHHTCLLLIAHLTAVKVESDSIEPLASVTRDVPHPAAGAVLVLKVSTAAATIWTIAVIAGTESKPVHVLATLAEHTDDGLRDADKMRTFDRRYLPGGGQWCLRS